MALPPRLAGEGPHRRNLLSIRMLASELDEGKLDTLMLLECASMEPWSTLIPSNTLIANSTLIIWGNICSNVHTY